MILQAFELLKNYVGTILSANLANNPYLQKIILTYNAETKHWDVNVDQAVALLQEAFEADATNGKIEMLQLSNILQKMLLQLSRPKVLLMVHFLKPNYLILVTILSEVQPMTICSAPKETI